MIEKKYIGNDNHGKPKSDYLGKLSTLDDAQLRSEVNQMIWLSTYASNNPRSDYHWMCDACYEETVNRKKVYIYEQEHAKLVKEVGG